MEGSRGRGRGAKPSPEDPTKDARPQPHHADADDEQMTCVPHMRMQNMHMNAASSANGGILPP